MGNGDLAGPSMSTISRELASDLGAELRVRIVPVLNTGKDLAARAAWLLPHDVRRSMFLRLNPSSAQLYDVMRTHELGDVDGMTVSLAGFEELEAIFVHIPKNGGTSAGRSLVGKYNGNHMPIRTYQMIYSKSDYDRFFKFAFSRNPFDRLISGYRSLAVGVDNVAVTDVPGTSATEPSGDRLLKPRSGTQAWNNFRDFEHFVTEWVTPGNTRRFEHFRPQHRFVCSPDGRLQPDFIGRFENFDADFAVVAERLGVETGLVHDNRTLGKKKRSYADYYTPSTRRIVERIYRKDLELFDYAFGD